MSRPLAQVKLVLVLTLLALLSSGASASANVAVTIIVHPPANTPVDANFTLLGITNPSVHGCRTNML